MLLAIGRRNLPLGFDLIGERQRHDYPSCRFDETVCGQLGCRFRRLEEGRDHQRHQEHQEACQESGCQGSSQKGCDQDGDQSGNQSRREKESCQKEVTIDLYPILEELPAMTCWVARIENRITRNRIASSRSATTLADRESMIGLGSSTEVMMQHRISDSFDSRT